MTAQISLYELYFQDYLNDCNGYHEFVTNKTRPLQLNYTEYRGPDVLISLSLGQYMKASVWNFHVMTARTRLISGT